MPSYAATAKYDVSPPGNTLKNGQTYYAGPFYCLGAKMVVFTLRFTGGAASGQSVGFNPRFGTQQPAAIGSTDGLSETAAQTQWSVVGSTTLSNPAINTDYILTVVPSDAKMPGLIPSWGSMRIPSISTADMTGVTITATVTYDGLAPITGTPLFASTSS